MKIVTRPIVFPDIISANHRLQELADAATQSKFIQRTHLFSTALKNARRALHRGASINSVRRAEKRLAKQVILNWRGKLPLDKGTN